MMESSHQVELVRTYKFRNSGQTYTGVPIMAANMDTVGTFEVARSLNKVGTDTSSNRHPSFCFVCCYLICYAMPVA